MANSKPSMRLMRRARLIGLIAAFGGVISALAQAQTHRYVLPDGRTLPLNRSSNELGLLFQSTASIPAATARLDATPGIRIRALPVAASTSVRIAEVADTSDATRGALEQDPAVREVCTVFRFAGEPLPVFGTGTIVTKLRPGLSGAQRQSMWSDYGLFEVEAMHRLHDVYLVGPVVAGDDEVALAEQLAGDPRTLWANPDLRQLTLSLQNTPADPFFKDQWHLQNTGQTLLFGVTATAGADIEAPAAWDIATGSGVLFGFIDTGADVDHADLRGNYIGIGQDLELPDGVPGATDPGVKAPGDDHATSVIGLSVAQANEIGVRGVSFDSKFTLSRGIGFNLSDSSLARGYTFAMDQNVDVHNNSWGFVSFFGGVPNPPVLVDAIQTAFNEGRDLDGPGGDDPLGMVILFSSGNEGVELQPGFGMATIPEVIGVGSSDPDDVVSSFSNFGRDMECVSPGELTPTTDNEDDVTPVEPGFNVGGFTFGGVDLDPDGNYTGSFSGTSAACPVASGVAGLILSVNKQLTASDVRIIIEHTCDKVSPIDARYNAISDKSLLYGHGRINARRAVEAARDSLSNGDNTWPDVAQNVRVVGTTLRWSPGVNTTEFLVVERVADFGFMPLDGACYDVRQAGCESGVTAALPDNVNVLFVGCASGCLDRSVQSVDFELPAGGRKFFAIYARNEIGRYSFGAPIDFEGKTTGGTGTLPLAPPRPTIGADPFPPSGKAPFTVRFNGNAISDQPLDDSKTTWDFDLSDGDSADAVGAAVSHVYEAPGVFTARLTMFDVSGVKGTAEIRITVDDPNPPDTGGASPVGDIRIVVGLPGTPGASATEGMSPFAVELQLEADTPANVQSIAWDLGDGTARVPGAAVLHTYLNEGDSPLVFLVTANVTSTSPGGTTVTTSAQEFITVLPGQADLNTGQPTLPGTGTSGGGGAASPCGVIGMVPMMFMFFSLVWLRRRSV